MCPLRYILLLLSLLVAAIGLAQAMSIDEKACRATLEAARKERDAETDGEEEEDCNTEETEVIKPSGQSPLWTLVDMLNGKYLLDAWRLYRQPHAKAV